MRTAISTLLMLCFAVFQSSAQDSYFKSYQLGGQTLNSRLAKAKDGGYIQVGTTQTPRDTLEKYGITVTKFDANTNVQWTWAYTDSNWGKRIDYGYGLFNIEETSDNNFIISTPAGGNRDFADSLNTLLVFKINNAGILQWSKNIDFAPSSNYYFESKADMRLSATNEIYITGNLYANMSVPGNDLLAAFQLKMSPANGSILWFNATNLTTVAGNSFTAAGSVMSSNGTWSVVGNVIAPDLKNIAYILTYNTSGAITANKSYGIGDAKTGSFRKVAGTPDLGYIISGDYTSALGKTDLSAIKLDASGNLTWAKKIGKTDIPGTQFNESAWAVNTTSDNGYLLGGSITSHKTVNGYMLKLDNQGKKVWFSEVPSKERVQPLYFTDVYTLADGYLGAGNLAGVNSYRNYFIVEKFDADGNSCREHSPINDTTTALTFQSSAIVVSSTSLIPDVVVSGTDLERKPNNVNLDVVCTGDIILPLHLISFTAEKAGKTNLLKWATEQEINFARFEIEKSATANNFSAIGNIQAAATPGLRNNYTFTDASPLYGNNFYRLKMVDKDGKFSYSNIVSVGNAGITGISIYPNFVQSDLSIHINTATAMEGQLQITDAVGKVVYTQKLLMPEGTYIKTINVSNYAKGYYFANIITPGGSVFKTKFLKQ